MPRQKQLQQFMLQCQQHYPLNANSLTPASSDASFRRYYRVQGNLSSYIIMDAPPEHENCDPFVQISSVLAQKNIQVPIVLQSDLENGFLLLTDLGSTTYLQALSSGMDHRPLYDEAINALVKLQTGTPAITLPNYDTHKLMQEMDLFEAWFLNVHHAIFLTEHEKKLLNIALNLIQKACTQQAQVLVHRDYHCRNLMYSSPNNPGVLDFQDAVIGPYSYDLVSLLRDAYIDWPEEAQIDLAVNYWKKAQNAGVSVPEDFGALWRDYEWMGLQRHLKVLGIFARLAHRDQKTNYLNDLPLVLKYAQNVAQRYDGLGILVRLFDRVQGVERSAGVTF